MANNSEALKILYIIDEVQSFLAIGKRYPFLAKAPKHFMLDPAIALNLFGVSREQLETYRVSNHGRKFNQTLIGQLSESLVYQSLIVYTNANEAQMYHFRDARGTLEIEFILQKGNFLILFEVKADPDAKEQYAEHLKYKMSSK